MQPVWIATLSPVGYDHLAMQCGLKLAECSVLPKMRNQAMKSWYSAEQWMLGSVVLASMAVACMWLLIGPIPTAFAYLTATALLIASLLVSFIVTRLVWGTRRQLAAALRGRARAEHTERELRLAVDAIPALVWSATSDGSRDFHSQRVLEFTGLGAAEADGEGWIAALAQRLSRTGSFGWRPATGEIIWSDEAFRICGYDKVPFATIDMVVERIHPDDRALAQQIIDRALNDGKEFDHGYRLLMPGGAVKYVHARAHAVEDASSGFAFVGAVTDVTAQKRAEEELHEAQANLAHVTRVTALGELTASIAHEVSQPLAAVVTNAEACLRWLDRETPSLDKVRDAVKSIVNDGHRAGEVIQRVRGLVNKTATRKVPLNINDVVSEVATLVQHELVSHGVALRMGLAPALPLVLADRIQMQQVILNLVINGIEAMESLTDRPRELVIRTHQDGPRQILVMVKDCGVGIAVEDADRLFNPFFTTKSSGMGMGLSICRSIIDSHGGRLSVSDNIGPGATFQFTLPLPDEDNPP